jgi:hypothetical protein
MGHGQYILIGHEAVHEPNLLFWGQWCYETANSDRIVKQDYIGGIFVSTVFLGLDHNWLPGGPPVLFETMVFGGRMDMYQDRCCTWEEAEQMHATIQADVIRNLEWWRRLRWKMEVRMKEMESYNAESSMRAAGVDKTSKPRPWGEQGAATRQGRRTQEIDEEVGHA